ncbi:MAG: hypothetical protein AB7O24_12255 [Kofleriaceae bacterium]
MKTLVAWLSTALIATGACTLDYEPDVGPELLVVGCDNSDSDPNVGVSFAHEVRPLLTRSSGGCSCHGGRQTSGFDLGSYESLRRGGLNSGTEIVVPGEPCSSILTEKLGGTPPFGSRMPLNGPYFEQADVIKVRDWIAEGALDN